MLSAILSVRIEAALSEATLYVYRVKRFFATLNDSYSFYELIMGIYLEIINGVEEKQGII